MTLPRRAHVAVLVAVLSVLPLLAGVRPVAAQVPPAPTGPVVVNDTPDGRPAVRLDTNGNALDAHDGGLLLDGGRWWLYGSAYSCGQEWQARKTPNLPARPCGVRAYSSPDLVTWTDEGLLVGTTVTPPEQYADVCFHLCWRPKIVRNPATGQWVMWINSWFHFGPDGTTRLPYTVYTAPSITGPWTFAASIPLPENAPGEDFTLMVDADGAAYGVFVISSLDYAPVVLRLDPTYTAIDALETSLRVVPGGGFRESPFLVRRGATYVLGMGDPNCGFCGAGLSVQTAPGPLGPWGAKQLVTPDACGTQSSAVAQVQTSGGTREIWLGDRWWSSPASPWDRGSSAGTTGNQGPAPFVLELLAWDGDLPRITCPARWLVPADLVQAGAPPPGQPAPELGPPGPFGLACARTSARWPVQAVSAGPAAALDVNLFASFRPTSAPLLTLRAPGGGVAWQGSAPLADPVTFDPQVVSWAPWRVVVPMAGVTLESGVYELEVRNTSEVGCIGVLEDANGIPRASVAVRAGAATSSRFAEGRIQQVPPFRALDTRETRTRLTGHGSVVAATVSGRDWVPLARHHGAVLVNVTAVDPATAGYLRVWPCDEPMPESSTSNFLAGRDAAVAVLTDTDDQDRVCVASNTAVDVVVDVTGYVDPAAVTTEQRRLFDSRVDGDATATDPPVRRVLRVGPDARAAAVNLTAVNRGPFDGWAQAWPCDAPQPFTSNVNPRAGRIASNLVVTDLGAGGLLCVAASAPGIDLVVDLQATFERNVVGTSAPERVVDTRSGLGGRRLAGLAVLRVPAGPLGSAFNLTVVDPARKGWLRAWPCDLPYPATSTANFVPEGPDVAAATALVTTESDLCVQAQYPTDLVVDRTVALAAGRFLPAPGQPVVVPR